MSRLPELERIAAKSKKPLPWYGLAMEYRSAGEYAKSIETFQKVHTLDPNYVAAYFMCAQVYAEHLQDNASARAELERGIEVARAVGDAHAVGEMTGMLEALR